MLAAGVRAEEPLKLDLATLPAFALNLEDLRQYGQTLGSAIFHGDIRDIFVTTLARAEWQGWPVHISTLHRS